MIPESPSNQPDWVLDLAALADEDNVAVDALNRIFGDVRLVFALHPERRRALWDLIISRGTEPTTHQEVG